MRKMMNRKIVLGVAALICCVATIALCSFFPFIIDPSRWQTKEFLTDELIISAICVFSIVCVMFIGQASNAQNPGSNIAKARVRFSESLPKVSKDVNAFSQWVRKVLQPGDIRAERERILLKAGIEDVSVLDLTEAEIASLVGLPQKYGDRFYKAITKQQAKAILSAKRFKMRLVDPQYYLSCSNAGGEFTVSRKSGSEARKKGTLLSFSIASKILLTVAIGMIFASLAFDMSSGAGGSQASAWMKFAARMSAMATSSFMGFLIGSQMNDIDADYVNIRCLVHDMFLQDRDFKPESQREEARGEFAERVRAETLRIGLRKG